MSELNELPFLTLTSEVEHTPERAAEIRESLERYADDMADGRQVSWHYDIHPADDAIDWRQYEEPAADEDDVPSAISVVNGPLLPEVLPVHAFLTETEHSAPMRVELRADLYGCPASRDFACSGDFDPDGRGCQTFTCMSCWRVVPWCFGGADDGGDDLCTDCWAELPDAAK